MIEAILIFLIYVCIAAALVWIVIYVLTTVMGWQIPPKLIQIAWVVFGLVVLLLLVRMVLPHIGGGNLLGLVPIPIPIG